MTLFHVPAGQPVQELIDSGVVHDGDVVLLGRGHHSGFRTRGIEFTVSSAEMAVIDRDLELGRVDAEMRSAR